VDYRLAGRRTSPPGTSRQAGGSLLVPHSTGHLCLHEGGHGGQPVRDSHRLVNPRRGYQGVQLAWLPYAIALREWCVAPPSGIFARLNVLIGTPYPPPESERPMGVDYYQCAACKQSIYEESVARCASCNEFVCVWCAIRVPKQLKLKSGGIFYTRKCASLFNEDNKLLSKHCPMCSGKAVSDKQAMTRLLKKSRTTRAKVDNQIVEERKNTKKAVSRKKPSGTKPPRKAATKKSTSATRRPKHQ
jgi:hypothetical protein